ncbi:MAG: hypothetical protein ACYC61_23495 [Isosphaeraceae bacterium]
MADVLSRRSRSASPGSWSGCITVLCGLIVLLGPSLVLGQSPSRKSRAADEGAPKARGKAAGPDQPKARGKAADEDEKGAAAPDLPDGEAAEGGAAARVSPVDVFRDPAAANLLGMNKLVSLPSAPVAPSDILLVKEMAANPNVTPDRAVIERVVKGLVANLTDRKSIQALLEEPEPDPVKAPVAAKKGAPARKKAESDGGKVIEKATTELLEPIYRARAAKNDDFLKIYSRTLNQHLPPLLRNHLIPRIQAMIILGQAGGTESLTLFQNEIASRSQVLWVKLWALEGICNIKEFGGRFAADEESRVARVVSDFLKQKDLPWLIQLRGLQALGALRQAALPTAASLAPMANTAMSYLADPEARLDVRSEAARALGLMNVSSVPRYNHRLVAYGIGLVAADLGDEFNELFIEKPASVQNRPKAQYLAALLAGPVYQGLEGVPERNNSGVIQAASSDQESARYVRKVMDLVKQETQALISLLGSPPSQYKNRKQDLAKTTAALRKFLADNPPPSRRLVDKGPQFNFGQPAGAWRRLSEQPVADNRRGE